MSKYILIIVYKDYTYPSFLDFEDKDLFFRALINTLTDEPYPPQAHFTIIIDGEIIFRNALIWNKLGIRKGIDFGIVDRKVEKIRKGQDIEKLKELAKKYPDALSS